MPLVSIIIPLHNKGSYIRKTLESAQKQSMQEWEALVIENHSVDDGPSQVKASAFSDPRIRLIHSPPEVRGPGAARNCGILEARGEWILFLDADDWIEPDYLEIQLACAENNPGIQVVAGSWMSIDATSNAVINVKRPPGWGLTWDGVCADCFGYAPWVVHAAIVRTDWIRPLRMWPEHLDRLNLEDMAFWFRVVLKAEIGWSESEGAIYRENTPTSRNDGANICKRFESIQRVVETNLATLDELGISLAVPMHESIVRTFESYFWLLRRDGSREMSESALHLARQWLRTYAGSKPSMVVRKILGVKLTGVLCALLRRR